ncbi:NAD(P)-binding protein [Macrolepiota fuliginosa MF-IS2]|uniref:NAD(P)-binding protein n=1 Tax=Macrolepiota fuliginosa MF-IS2 TaxID=1400762 RepID=A0A9P5XMK2_9AGAR|nr:NAD(P)-binding protein [Macrolepiota fuliginosa MF-IS2]
MAAFGSSFSSKASLLDPDPVISGPDPTSSHFRFSPMNLFNVEGLVAVITGGGTGIGLMMATALENNGATVYIVGRRVDVLESAAAENSRFGKIIPIEGDITSKESLLSIVDVVKARHGYIDLLVNNAAIARNLYNHPLPTPATSPSQHPPSPPLSPSPDYAATPAPSIKKFQAALWETGTIEDWEASFQTNVTAVYYTTVAFLELLHQGNIRRQRFENGPPPYHSSQVISVSSSGSFRIDAKILSPSYTVSKSACTHLGKTMANLLAPWGIRSNVLAPGVWPTQMTTMPVSGCTKLDPDILASAVPLKRAGTEEDMAGTILYLASRAGAYLNGAVWLVDGGRVVSISSTY